MLLNMDAMSNMLQKSKNIVKTPVAALGGINDVDMMEEIIASGKADIIEVARQSLADPYFPEKAFPVKKTISHSAAAAIHVSTITYPTGITAAHLIRSLATSLNINMASRQQHRKRSWL